jgi:hypothetical protein
MSDVSNSSSMTDMTCEDILRTDLAQLGYSRSFDNKHGSVALIGGRACWSEITKGVKDADNFMRTKLQALEDKNYDLNGMNLPTLAEYVEMVDKIPNYSDGMLLLTGWKWNKDDVQPGQEVGLCLQQGVGFATCWGFKKNADGSFPKKNSSYSINLDKMNEDSHLYDYQDIGTFGTPGFEGTWACSPVVEMGKKNKVGCFRFMPKQEMSNIPDTRFTEGKINVVTYLEGRTVDPTEPKSECIKDRFKSEFSRF